LRAHVLVALESVALELERRRRHRRAERPAIHRELREHRRLGPGLDHGRRATETF
jgi:hypothetical protein